MPELPEVQTIANQLNKRLRDRAIKDVEVRLPKIFTGSRDQVIGSRIIGVERRAKIILIHLDNGYTIAVHLKMTGQLIFGEQHRRPGLGPGIQKGNLIDSGSGAEMTTEEKYIAETVSFSQGIAYAGFSLPSKATHVIFSLTGENHPKLFFNDLRQFGWVKIVTNDELQMTNEKLGPEPFSEEFTLEYFKKICSHWGRPIKLLLMDQEKIAGIGNIYANEALWYSEVSPMKRARDLAIDEVQKMEELYKNLKMVLEMGIKYQGASDNSYVNALGEKGTMQEYFKVYGKEGQLCERCQHKITFSKIGGRGTFFCPICQK